MARVRTLHFICAGGTHVVDRADGTFSTRFWKLGADAALQAESVALHETKDEPSYRQGRIIERHLVPYEDHKRYLFVIEPTPEPVPWERYAGVEKAF